MGKNFRIKAKIRFIKRTVPGLFKVLTLRFKFLNDLYNDQNVRLNLLQTILIWIAAIITGVVAVLYAKLFHFAELGFTWVYNYNRWLLFLISPLCFLAAYELVKKYSPYSRGSGIPQVMAGMELSNTPQHSVLSQLLSIRVVVIKIGSSMMMVLGGAVVGREGPTIQIASSIFKKMNDLLPFQLARQSETYMILAGAASGLAAAFNTPLGGIVFAVEELSKAHINTFKTTLFTSVIIAGLTAQAIAGPYLFLGYPDLSGISYSIFLPLLLTSVLAGLGGSYLCLNIHRLMKWNAQMSGYTKRIFFIVTCSLVIATIGVFLGPEFLGSGKEVMNQTLFSNNKHVEWYSPFIRAVGSLFSFSVGGAGGIFAPALSIGAGVGSVVANLLDIIGSDCNLLILAGMVAFLTGVTRTPFTSAILVLEMTDRHNVIFHMMFAGLIGGLAANLLAKNAFYDLLKKQYLFELTSNDSKK